MIDNISVRIEEIKPKIGIGIPVGKDVNPEFLKSLFARFADWMEKYIITIIIDNVIPIDLSRNNIVNNAKSGNCDYLFFIDSDIIIEKGQLERLLYQNKGAISGVYHQKFHPYQPLTRKKMAENLYLPIESKGDNIIEIDATGMGCFLIQMDIFDKIPYPWFEFKYNTINDKWYQLSEDFYFCKKLQDNGIKIYCDPTVQCKHIGTIVDPRLSEDYKEFRITIANERDKTIEELCEFTGLSLGDVHTKLYCAEELVAKEYIKFVGQDHRNPKDFYKLNKNYIFELISTHLDKKRIFDIDLVKLIKDKYPKDKKILDFGSGCGQNTIELANAGYNLSMAEFDGYTSEFARFRIKRRGLNVKFYDIEMPINDKFDIILAFNVLEYVPDKEFEMVIEFLRSLKTNNGIILTTTNFDKKSKMCYEESPKKLELIAKLK